MCGIVGIISLSPDKTVDPTWIRTMANAIKHRGPDDEGYFVRPYVALGNRRLSIIDLEAGKQPISTQDKRFTIVYNGEIFNYRKLREELKAKGSIFRTESDTEVVLVGFAKFGPSFLDRLEGMFTCLIYDSLEEALHICRDPFGIKPLYTFQDTNFLFIASEMKAIRKVVQKKFEMNKQALRSYLQCGYILGRDTLLKGVFKISPGAVLTISSKGEFTETPFSKQLLPQTLASGHMENGEIASTLMKAIDQSLVSDVPVGLYLSGGIDSSLIAAFVSRELGKKLNSYSIRFPNDHLHDEGPFAALVAKELGLSHEAIPVGPKQFEDFPWLVQTLEEPMVDPSAFALGILSRSVGKELKVVLSGEGGDELFGGYHRYFWDQFMGKYLEIPSLIRTCMEAFAGTFGGKKVQRRMIKLRETSNLTRPTRYMSWFGPFKKSELNQLLKDQTLENIEQLFARAFEVAGPLSESGQCQWVDMVTFLRDDLLAKADKMSMIHSLEVRVPFLQPQVVQAAFSLAPHQRVQMKQTKPYLRSLLEKYLPSEIVYRKKQGFEIPIGTWFLGPLKHIVDQYLSEEVVRNRGLFPWETILRIRKEHESKKEDRGLALFSLVMLEAWAQENLL